MTSAGKDKLKGVLHQAKGRAKEIAGKLTDNPKLEVKGIAEKIAGRAREKVGQIKTVFNKK